MIEADIDPLAPALRAKIIGQSDIGDEEGLQRDVLGLRRRVEHERSARIGRKRKRRQPALCPRHQPRDMGLLDRFEQPAGKA